jgi:hypothetical protein
MRLSPPDAASASLEPGTCASEDARSAFGAQLPMLQAPRSGEWFVLHYLAPLNHRA